MAKKLRVAVLCLGALICGGILAEENQVGEIQESGPLLASKSKSLNWLHLGDGYKTLAPIPNGDNFLLVGNDNTIYRKGYGRFGAGEITKASGPVGEIVSTQGNVQIGFDFVYTTNDGAMLYGYDGKNSYPINTDNVKGKITCLDYESDHGLFCGTDKGRVCQYVDNPAENALGSPGQGWFWRDLEILVRDKWNGHEYVSETPKKISSVLYDPEAGLWASCLCETSLLIPVLGVAGSNDKYEWKTLKLPKRNWASKLLTACGSYGMIIIGSDGRGIYPYQYVNGGWNVLRSIFSFASSSDTGDVYKNLFEFDRIASGAQVFHVDGKLWMVSELPDRSILSFNIQTRELIQYDGKLVKACVVDTLGTVYCINAQGQLFRSKPMANDLSVDVKYVSRAAGDSRENDAVYKITVTGKGLTRDQIFRDGFNGFKYKLTCDKGAQYTRYAYPIPGVRYIDTPWANQAGEAALNPRTISFLWLGPKNDGSKTPKVTVEQTMNGKPFGEPVSVPLPLAKAIELPRRLTLKITKEGNVAANTGTCAVPFSIQLSGDDGPLPNTSELYNRLVFYKAKDATGYDANAIVGADPLTDGAAVLTSDCVEIDGFVKYGSKDSHRGQAEHGRHFYLFLSGDIEQAVFPAIIKDDGSLATAASTLKQTPSTAKLSYSGITLDGEGNAGPVADFFLSESGQQVACSNISQHMNQNGAYHGYLDFILMNSGVFYLFPQGLSVDDVERRRDPAALSVGFYCAPLGQEKHDNPFWADKYQVGTYTGLVEATRNKNLHLVVFDRYGRNLNEVKRSGDGPIVLDRVPLYATNGTPSPIIMSSNFRKFGSGKKYDGKEVNGKGFSGIPASGLFMPPNMTEYTTCYVDSMRIIDSDPLDYERVHIDFQANTVLRKNHSLFDCASLEYWEVSPMRAKAEWKPGNVWFRNYASVVMGVEIGEHRAHRYVRLDGLCVAVLDRDQVGRYNRFGFLREGNIWKPSSDPPPNWSPPKWAFNEGYYLLTDGSFIRREGSHYVVGEVHAHPDIAITPMVKSALGR